MRCLGAALAAVWSASGPPTRLVPPPRWLGPAPAGDGRVLFQCHPSCASLPPDFAFEREAIGTTPSRLVSLVVRGVCPAGHAVPCTPRGPRGVHQASSV